MLFERIVGLNADAPVGKHGIPRVSESVSTHIYGPTPGTMRLA